MKWILDRLRSLRRPRRGWEQLADATDNGTLVAHDKEKRDPRFRRMFN